MNDYVHKGKTPAHRLIMEEFLGRKLKKEERIHHINGNKSDNRIENLKLFKNDSEHMKNCHNKGRSYIGMVRYGFYISGNNLKYLENLDGKTSEHIRTAISRYIEHIESLKVSSSPSKYAKSNN
jgi:hypothetical protein